MIQRVLSFYLGVHVDIQNKCECFIYLFIFLPIFNGAAADLTDRCVCVFIQISLTSPAPRAQSRIFTSSLVLSSWLHVNHREHWPWFTRVFLCALCSMPNLTNMPYPTNVTAGERENTFLFVWTYSHYPNLKHFKKVEEMFALGK